VFVLGVGDEICDENLQPLHVVYFLLLSYFSHSVGAFSLQRCFLAGRTAICSNHKLSQIPTDLPLSVRSIDLRGNNISNIQLSDFSDFPNVTSLNLKHNGISHIGKLTFSKLTSLRQLILSDNRIEILIEEVFHGLSKLKELLIDSNHIQSVEPNAFRLLSSLTFLNLSSNNLRTISQVHLRHMPLLNQLIIRNISITTFSSPDLANTSTQIKSLDLSRNPLEKFEVSADVFPKLNELSIGEPTLKPILRWNVQNSSVLSNVTTLDVTGIRMASNNEWIKLFSTFNSSVTLLNLNKMRFMKPDVLINLSCSLSKLQQLKIQKNSLIIGPNLFHTCHSVTSLNLRDNNIKRINDGSFSSFRRLQILILSYNRIQRVPLATQKLTSLQELDLSFNHIKTIGCHDFTGLENLKQLDLQQNKITVLSNCSFLKMNKLQILKLQGNLIAEFGSVFQTSLPNLKLLYLDRNKLTEITRDVFSGLKSLRDLFLAQNQIKRLHKGCFSGLTKLMGLQLQKNELKDTAFNSLYFEDLLNLRRLDLQNNNFKVGQNSHIKTSPFQNLSRLDSLLISGRSSAGHTILPSNFLQGLKSLSAFSCKKWGLSNFSENFFHHTPRLISLDISSNDLFEVPAEVFAPIPNLQKLQIGDTNLGSLDFLINANLTKLTFLNAQKNSFSVISENIIKSVPSLQELDLKQNSFTCDCENAWLVSWIINDEQTQVRDAHSFKCKYPPERKGSTLLQLNVQSCLLDVGFLCFICSSCFTSLILVATFIFHFSRFQLMYAYYLLMAWLFDSRKRQKHAECLYDGFVSYNSKDEAWVCEQLVPKLEQEQGWRLCLHHRDFLPGRPIVENIAEAVYRSRKTICVVSRRYLQSEWCSKELQLASFRLFDEREDVLILVFLEDIPSYHLSPFYRMKKLLQRRTYLSWTRAQDNPQLFWEKLRQALRSTSTGVEEERLRLTANSLCSE
uniref:TIR domain-containing protein n=1 Tax=Periophthalmus magnuspinnatus TaxID=409849 RepID=A0A3B4B194_9GOBI